MKNSNSITTIWIASALMFGLAAPSTSTAAGPFSADFAATSGLRPVTYGLRDGTNPACPSGDLQFVDTTPGRLNIKLGGVVLAKHVSDGEVRWTECDGCGMTTRTSVTPGHVELETIGACGRGEEPARQRIQTFPGGFIFRGILNGRLLTCALVRL